MKISVRQLCTLLLIIWITGAFSSKRPGPGGKPPKGTAQIGNIVANAKPTMVRLPSGKVVRWNKNLQGPYSIITSVKMPSVSRIMNAKQNADYLATNAATTRSMLDALAKATTQLQSMKAHDITLSTRQNGLTITRRIHNRDLAASKKYSHNNQQDQG